MLLVYNVEVIHFGEKGKSMSTGLAILLSIGLFILCVVIEAITGLHYIIISTMVFGTALWTGVDAHKIEFKKYKTSLGSTVYGGGGVFAAVLLVWIIFFPWYLYSRGKILSGKAKLRNGYESEAIKGLTMKKQIICRNCGSVGFPKKKCKGRLGIELTFWILPIVILLCTFASYSTEYNMTFDQFSSYISNPFEDAMSTLVLSGDPSGFVDLESLGELMSNMPPDKVLKLISGQEDTIILLNITFLLSWGIGLIYSLWRWMSRRPVCYSCGVGKDSLIPLDTPLGANLLNQYNHELPSDKKIDVIPQIEKLSELKEKGILSEEEFQSQKAKLLSS